MVECQFCGKEIPAPRMAKGQIIQKFCGPKCRWDYHNRNKLENFVKEMKALLEKYGYLRERKI
jgi:hypothetical protein